jgi:hypothetical protein
VLCGFSPSQENGPHYCAIPPAITQLSQIPLECNHRGRDEEEKNSWEIFTRNLMKSTDQKIIFLDYVVFALFLLLSLGGGGETTIKLTVAY